MKVFVNYPENSNEIDFESKITDFHAKLMIQKIKDLNISDSSKKKLLNSVLENLKKDV